MKKVKIKNETDVSIPQKTFTIKELIKLQKEMNVFLMISLDKKSLTVVKVKENEVEDVE